MKETKTSQKIPQYNKSPSFIILRNFLWSLCLLHYVPILRIHRENPSMDYHHYCMLWKKNSSCSICQNYTISYISIWPVSATPYAQVQFQGRAGATTVIIIPAIIEWLGGELACWRRFRIGIPEKRLYRFSRRCIRFLYLNIRHLCTYL